MNQISIKTTAEAVLRELPSVLGAYVSEDLDGNPREVHLLVRSGPDPAALARDLRGLLQDRLGIPVDQRVISIAQLSPEGESGTTASETVERREAEAEPRGVVHPPQEVGAAGPATPGATVGIDADVLQPDAPGGGFSATEPRATFHGIESTVSARRVAVGISLQWKESVVEGRGEAADTPQGRARAAATASLSAAMGMVDRRDLNLELDFASVVQGLDDEYVLVNVQSTSPRTGRRPVTLVGVHPVETDVESAATYAVLKAINRVLALALPTG
jgi:hypothetical protein